MLTLGLLIGAIGMLMLSLQGFEVALVFWGIAVTLIRFA
jgi:hypothetical protein